MAQLHMRHALPANHAATWNKLASLCCEQLEAAFQQLLLVQAKKCHYKSGAT
jgi:hypothetical protein